MNGEPTQRELYDAILNLQGAMLHGFSTLDGRMTNLEVRMTSLEARVSGVERRLDRRESRFDTLESRFDGLESRFHEFDEDFGGFRIEVNRRFDRVDVALLESNRRLGVLEAARAG
jgi:predicted nuclease with TOPRIM domain